MAERVKAAVDHGLEFILARQTEGGLWRDFRTPAGEASTWTTAYVAAALAGLPAGAAAVERAAGGLASSRSAEGGWGYNEQTPMDADSTSWSILVLTGLPGFRALTGSAGAALAGHQRPWNGGVATYAKAGPVRRYMRIPPWVPFWGWCRPHVEVTAVAGLAFSRLAGGGLAARTEAAWRYVRRRQRADGRWDSYWWPLPHVATQQAVELATVVDDEEAVRRAAAWIASAGQRATSPFARALCVSALARSGPEHRATLARLIDELIDQQAADGGWPSAAVLRIPPPPEPMPDHDQPWRPIRFGGGLLTRDHRRTFTSATCMAAMVRAECALAS